MAPMLTAQSVIRQAGALFHTGVDTILPPGCISCSQPVSQIGNLCADCFSDIAFIGDQICTICGLPFQTPTPPDTLCAGCAASRPVFSRARAATIYGGKARDLILALKHGDRTDMAPHLARWMARAGDDLIRDNTVFTSVPLHASRLRRRKYNQAGLLATALARHTGHDVCNTMLTRKRRTRSQGGLTRAGRRRNVTGAFRVADAHRPDVVDARIIVVDDVMTTGATVEAAARTMYRAGAKDVSILTLARVVIVA